MKRILLASAAALALSATASLAQTVADQVVAGLQAQGFTRIEVTEGPTQVKMEAIQGSTKVEYIYDRSTGAILKQEVEPVRPGEDTSPGVRVRSGDDSVRGGDDDGPLHDLGDDHGGDDRFDDHGGDDRDEDGSGRRGSDDGEGDDHSGRSGGDDDGDRSGSGSGGSGSDDDDDGDDHGGSRHGSDDD